MFLLRRKMFKAIMILLILSPLIHYSNTDNISIDNIINIFHTERIESIILSENIDACIIHELNNISMFTNNTEELNRNSLHIKNSIAIFFKFMNMKYKNVRNQLFSAYKSIQRYAGLDDLLSFNKLITYLKSNIGSRDAKRWSKKYRRDANAGVICNHIFTVFTDNAALKKFMDSLNRDENINIMELKYYQLTSNIVTFQNKNNDVFELLIEHYKDLLCLYKQFLRIIHNFINELHIVSFQLQYLTYVFNVFIDIYEFSNNIIFHIEKRTDSQQYRNEISLLHSAFRLYILQFIDDDSDTIIRKVENHNYLKFLFVDNPNNENVVDFNTSVLKFVYINDTPDYACKSLKWIWINYSNCTSMTLNGTAISEGAIDDVFKFTIKMDILKHNLSLSEYTVKYITDYFSEI